jgi:hypothetical protein
MVLKYMIGIATGYGLDARWEAVRVPVGSRIFTSPYHPDRLWDPPSLPTIGYREQRCWGMKPRSRKRESTHPFPHVFMA